MLALRDLSSRHIAISGASGSIGQRLTKEIVELGGNVSLFTTSTTVKSPEKAMGNVTVISLETYQESEIREKVARRFAEVPIDSMVCLNGHVSLAPALNSLTSEAEVWEANYWVPLRFIGSLLSCPQNEFSIKRIIGLSSVSAIRPQKGMAAYGSAKAALEAYFRCLAQEKAKSGTTFTIFRAGLLDSAMSRSINDRVGDAQFAKISDQYPLGIGSPQDLAEHISLGLMDYAGWVTGNIVDVDGGYLA